MIILFLVEEESLESSLPHLLKKIKKKKIIRLKSMESRDVKKVINLIQINPADKAIILTDSECKKFEVMQNILKPIEIKISRAVRIPVFYVPIICMLETWLLADNESLSNYLSIKIPTILPAGIKHDDYLESLFRQAGKKRHYKKTVEAPLIAQRVNPIKIARRSPSFDYLLQCIEK